ncbi:hypothetical protein SUGI_1353770 [Cryptomeria japonica]|uniref:Uncharacterized protein n=2 Tax=Cryptomeria japonica TaxID=3369 RepID=A0AAD3NQZ1_CRYJA|nr:hypothetical protein SUGI_1353730 [Cryptomeria japonica]GLJ57616.1 hypothetical protein SUGI_1353770 [Cryptomeria japonica]
MNVHEDRSDDEVRYGYIEPPEDMNGHEEERNLEDGIDENMKVHAEERYYEDGSDESRYGHGGPEEVMNNHEEEHHEDGSYQRRYGYRRYRYGGPYEDRNWYAEAATFEQIYQCYPPIYTDKPELEKANKIIMPPSALSRLISQEIEYPMLFQLQNTITGCISHCGVLEFVAEEGIIYMPLWMMENMLLQPGDIVKLKHTTLPKGTSLKLQPHTKNLLDISNPKAFLEVSLRNFSCLTTGDTIKLDYNNTIYCINIVETKPESAISVFDADVAPPLDYKEPERLPLNPANICTTATSARSTRETTTSTEHEEKSQCRFTAFTGVGRRLNGKPVSPKSPKVKSARSRSPSRAPIRKPGKLVFGDKTYQTHAVAMESGKVAAQKSEKESEEAEKFKPFTGKKYSLKD